ncbi:MAG: lysophospholipid acyltransferase family protein [Bryobacteraceae bacterium]
MAGLEYLCVRVLLWCLERAPLSLAWPLALGAARLLDLVVPRLRRTAIHNLELARLPHPERIADGVFRSIARIILSVARLPRLNRQNISEWIRYEGFEHFERAKLRGKGVLFATAHLGNWELSAFAHALMAEPMNIVVRPLDNPRIDKLAAARRAASGNTLIGKHEAARAILRALRENQAVGILIDQNTSLDEGTFVDFFGIPASAGTAFAKIAAHSGATVIPGFALWEESEQRYVLRFYPPLEITGDAIDDTRRLHRQLESVIRQYPDQWLWIHRRWKTRPPGGTPLY